MAERNRQLAVVLGLIGGRWARGAAGPDTWDCGALTGHVQEALFGRTLPVSLADYGELSSAEALRQAIGNAALAETWPAAGRAGSRDAVERLTVAAFRHGDVLVIRRGDYCHVGTWLDFGRAGHGVLHAARGEGVVFEDWITVRKRGWTAVEVCRPAGDGAA